MYLYDYCFSQKRNNSWITYNNMAYDQLLFAEYNVDLSIYYSSANNNINSNHRRLDLY